MSQGGKLPASFQLWPSFGTVWGEIHNSEGPLRGGPVEEQYHRSSEEVIRVSDSFNFEQMLWTRRCRFQDLGPYGIDFRCPDSVYPFGCNPQYPPLPLGPLTPDSTLPLPFPPPSLLHQLSPRGSAPWEPDSKLQLCSHQGLREPSKLRLV